MFAEQFFSTVATQSVQKHNRMYSNERENTTWSREQFEEYIESHRQELGVQESWCQQTLHPNIKRILQRLVLNVQCRLNSVPGVYELFGCDFLVDSHMKVWLLEVNANPALGLHNKAQSAVIPEVVHEALGIGLESIGRAFRQKPIAATAAADLLFRRHFEWLTDSLKHRQFETRPNNRLQKRHQRQQRHCQEEQVQRRAPSCARKCSDAVVSARERSCFDWRVLRRANSSMQLSCRVQRGRSPTGSSLNISESKL